MNSNAAFDNMTLQRATVRRHRPAKLNALETKAANGDNPALGSFVWRTHRRCFDARLRFTSSTRSNNALAIRNVPLRKKAPSLHYWQRRPHGISAHLGRVPRRPRLADSRGEQWHPAHRDPLAASLAKYAGIITVVHPAERGAGGFKAMRQCPTRLVA